MRLSLILTSILFSAAAGAQAEPLSVNKGQWRVSQDLYSAATVEGEPLDLPAENTILDECWSLDEEVLIDESMVAEFEGCVSTGVTSRPFGMEIGLECNFEGLDVDGSALFAISHDRDSFVAQIYLASLTTDPVDFQSHMLMIGHRTGACKAPG